MKKLALLVSALMISLISFSQQEKTKEVAKATILTSAVCNMCKTTLEKGMAYEKGVKKSELDVSSKILTVWYRSDKTTEEALRKAVSKIGYDADSIPADPKAYENLNPCCKKGYHD
jgi:mercuric ion binding protein